mgnify:CR=1 FL=1
MKINKKQLDQLITEVINEKISYRWPDIKDNNPTGLGRQKFAKMANISIDQGEKDPDDEADSLGKRALTDKDIQLLINDPSLITSTIESYLIGIARDATDNELKGLAQRALDNYNKEREAAASGAQSFTQPIIRTSPAQSGQFNSEIDSILTSIFGNTGDIIERTKKVAEISNVYYQATQSKKAAAKLINSKSKRQVMTEVMLLDYLAEVVKSFDSGAGGYVFEYFLALMTGGSVTGKETGPQPGMGGVDFRSKSGAAGSSKYFSTPSGMKQSSGGFEIGEPVDYIIGIKKQRQDQTKTAGGTADPSKIVAVQIYAFRLTRIGDTKFGFQKLNKDGRPTERIKPFDVPMEDEKYGKINISSFLNNSTFLTTMRIAEVRTKTFKDMIYSAIKVANESKFNPMLKAMENYINSMRKAEAKSKMYSTEKGTLEHGNEAFEALFAAENYMEDLVKAIDPSTQVTGAPQTQRKINENNLDNLLDKLIQEVILSK